MCQQNKQLLFLQHKNILLQGYRYGLEGNMNDTRKARRTRMLTATLFAVLNLLAAWPARQAAAHPLGNFSINHYSRLEVAPTAIQIYYVVDLAEIPTFQLKKKIDANGDNLVDAAEQQAYVAPRVEELRNGVSLVVNGTPVGLQSRSPEWALSPGQGGLETLRLSFWLDGALPDLGSTPAAIEFTDKNDVDRLGWREIVLRAKDGANVSGANVSDKDVSDELRNYPQDLLNSPLKQTSASFSLAGLGGSAPVAAATQAAPATFGESDSSSQLAGLINYRELTPQVAALALLTALGLGALHALEPGHGKSVAAAYLVGSRATPKHAILLGTTVTVTHTFSVFLMGLVTLFLSSFIVPERLFPYLGLISAFIVIVMGISMIVTAIRQRKTADLAIDHTHEFDPNTNELKHAHGGKQHTHVPPLKMNARNVLAVGISGGLVPCPGALIVLLSAIALGRVGFGMLLILAFSVGLAGVLTAMSLGVVYGKRAISKSSYAARFANARNSRLVAMMPVFSGLLVIGAGLLLLYYAVPFLQLA
jgi:ABC-type nickel/cobalt efflux system permease component RcnA